MSGLISIVFTGLCALVAGGDERPAQVLLVDAKGIGAVNGVTLVVSLSSLANPDASGPDRVVTAWPGRGSAAGSAPGRSFGVPEQVGLWDLRGSEIRIKAQGLDGSGVELFPPPPGRSSWPAPPAAFDDPLAWRDIRFVPDMNALTGDGRIDPTLLGEDDITATALPERVAARVFLGGGRLQAGVPSQKVFRDRIFEFGIAGAEPKRQALTDAAVWTLDAGARTVVIEIVPMNGGPVKRLVLAPDARSHELFISNLPAENMPGGSHQGMSEDEMAALHFGAYYELLLEPPGDRPLPRLWRGSAQRKAVGLMGTSMCPPALFRSRSRS